MADKNIAKKEKAIEIMKKMDIYKPYIKGFRESDKVCFFEGFGGFWIDQEPEVYAKMKAIEKKYGSLSSSATDISLSQTPHRSAATVPEREYTAKRLSHGFPLQSLIKNQWSPENNLPSAPSFLLSAFSVRSNIG